ncbi:MAG: hypothetical protein ABTQ34_00925 [Bdellovibrionales bacterium]
MMFSHKLQTFLPSLAALGLLALMAAPTHAAEPPIAETPPQASDNRANLPPSEKRAKAEEYKKLRIEREKLSIERAQLNIRCLEAKDADKKDCMDKKRALREKIGTLGDKIHDMREKHRADRRMRDAAHQGKETAAKP